MVDVSIIIVNYNTCKLTLECIESVYKQTSGISYEIIVSDNGSSDDSVEMIKELYSEVIVIENRANIGFGAANNRAIDVAKGKYLLFLNSDTILQNNAVKLFYDYWENADINLGALGAHLIGTDGKYTHSYGTFPTYNSTYFFLFRAVGSSIFGRFKKPTLEKQDNHVKDMIIDGYVTGADLFIKNEGTKFDERFFMYDEESDLQYNLIKGTDKKICVISGPRVVHLEGGSDKTKEHSWYDFRRKSSIYYWISRIKYLRKNMDSNIKIQLLKFFVILVWMFPCNWHATKEYYRELISL